MSHEVTLVKNDCSVVINLQGAHVISWKINGKEQLFITPGSVFDGKSEVYGGIPIVFPRLGFWGEGKPFHGFARTALWQVLPKEEGKGDSDSEKLSFFLRSDDISKAYFDAEFALTLTVGLGEAHLSMDLRVENQGENSFDFTALFHNYLRVEDIGKSSLHGLSGASYKDAADG